MIEGGTLRNPMKRPRSGTYNNNQSLKVRFQSNNENDDGDNLNRNGYHIRLRDGNRHGDEENENNSHYDSFHELKFDFHSKDLVDEGGDYDETSCNDHGGYESGESYSSHLSLENGKSNNVSITPSTIVASRSRSTSESYSGSPASSPKSVSSFTSHDFSLTSSIDYITNNGKEPSRFWRSSTKSGMKKNACSGNPKSFSSLQWFSEGLSSDYVTDGKATKVPQRRSWFSEGLSSDYITDGKATKVPHRRSWDSICNSNQRILLFSPFHHRVRDVPAGSDDISAKTKISKPRIRWSPANTLRIKNPIFLLLAVCLFSMGGVLYTQSYAGLIIALEQVTVITQERQEQVVTHFDTIENDLRNFQRKLVEVQNSNNSERTHSNDRNLNHRRLNDTNEGIGALASQDSFDEMFTIQEKLRIENSRITSLKKFIRDTSFRDATRKYGTGVIRVRLELDFPEDREVMQPMTRGGSIPSISPENGMPSSGVGEKEQEGETSFGTSLFAAPANNNGKKNNLVIEMASLDLMPHSVYRFLEMVDHKLLNGCSFVLNAMHIVKAAPLTYDGSSAAQKIKLFTELGLDTLSFNEYSELYPHQQYTVGFATDGSPSFYINTKDNTEKHAGQPCFGTIVKGFETIDRLETAPTRNGIWYKKRIGIKQAIIL